MTTTTASLPEIGSFEQSIAAALKRINLHDPSAQAERDLRRAAWLAAGAADVWVSASENVDALMAGWRPGMRPSRIVEEAVNKALVGDSRSAYVLLNMAKMADNAVRELTEAFEGMEFMPLIS